MASAVLASLHEPHWGERKFYMRDSTNSVTFNTNIYDNNSNNSNLYPYPYPPPNLNPVPRHLPLPLPPPPPPRIIQDASSGGVGYVKFNVDSFNRREIKELKRRLILELEQVRALRTRLETLGSEIRSVLPLTGVPEQRINTTEQATGGVTKRKGAPRQDVNRKSKRKQQVVSEVMKRYGLILTKLMKHKVAYLFNTPVDVVGLGLYDYNQIIKKPMDLGTVKVNLKSGVYTSALEFAADVRLVFDNAMVYNPKDHHVHLCAQQLLAKFDQMLNPVCKKFGNDHIRVSNQVAVAPPVQPVARRSQSGEMAVETMERVVQVGGRAELKPKARDPKRRVMNFDEKRELGREIEELPSEKMDQIVDIVNKRAGSTLVQDGNEVELDMEILDNETLWELHRFVCNHKKMRSPGLTCNDPIPSFVGIQDRRGEMEVDVEGKLTVEEEVDIGDDIPIVNYPSVEIEKDVVSDRSNDSSSSSSSSDSSSSSGSESGSSSGGESDAENAQPPHGEAESGNVPREGKEGLQYFGGSVGDGLLFQKLMS